MNCFPTLETRLNTIVPPILEKFEAGGKHFYAGGLGSGAEVWFAHVSGPRDAFTPNLWRGPPPGILIPVSASARYAGPCGSALSQNRFNAAC